jgi:cytochrome d ubiquinol oxidase subunit I
MLLVAALAVLAVLRNQVGRWKLLAAFPFMIALPYLANSFGWILTEIGRQPWVVYGLLKTKDAVSPNLTPGMVLTTIIGFTLVYALLMAADVYLLVKYAKAGAQLEAAPEVVKVRSVDEEAYRD